MELRNLHTFKVVAEVKGFTKAAELLSYAQSSVTAQIQSLEEELKTRLFDRLGKKVILTTAGEKLLSYATQILELHDAAIQAITSDSVPAGTLIIGAPESLAAFRLPAIIREYTTLYPQVKIILRPGVCWELRSLARNGELDVVFLLEPEAQEAVLYIETLATEKMVIIAPPEHPLATGKNIKTPELKNETFLHTEPGCSYRTLFEAHLNSCGVFPGSDLEFWSIEAIKNCVMSGLGLSFLPLITVEKEIMEGKIAALDWDDSACRVATQMAYHKKKWLSPALKEFLSLVGQHAKRWRQQT
ncbi:LysR family transcriptional regulator [Aneurinibacillus thermoaerophilus]|uniref:LysR family transcriptional regulator n=1 Tax=Aneurinibacillus thermoaerophilus TaxID=143495 RepID=UPI002E203E0D|nr:LysR family transcriptional regulator [Aneurinibacillus thermoaerophilus]MED0762439.1 LysR family transcriptional regulator [Aneurinibacillus thermoaerophilus]